ncbi:ArsR family regulatory protein [Alcanivorax sp. S71-1-4]|jgi:DNA-binding transcriptional ArsR family regulator|uniref:Transcriptional regulator n=1 Tax=Isoalcanivorax pacificus W11-5 TaxID=391936 RepID=A0A0B4XT70_9GAMM|nr:MULTISPECIES: metalloregulator ArsR/SmtB family transcription factor [Alcanivoracaceae]AJD49900.1 transcriptional regulator [Isoalcanivorax pacificus W11-5]KAF0810832.1 ArsR family regulatory protein [Alcanivorax sp. S71-1-4]
MPDTTAISLDQMRAAAGDATLMLRSLAHQDRLLLLCQLSQEEMCVSDLEQRLGIQQPSLSQQLGVLRREGLVLTRREGKHVYYRVADARVLGLLQTLYTLFCDTGEARHAD